MSEKKIINELDSLSKMLLQYFEKSSTKVGLNDVTGANGRIIGYLGDNRNKDIYQKDLEKKFGITRSAASKIVNRMEQKELIKRKNVEFDARLKKLELTPEAIEIYDKMKQESELLEDKMIYGFSEDELVKFYSYVNRMQNNLK